MSGKDLKGVSGIVMEIMTEPKIESTDFGPKTRCTMKITNGTETHEKKLTWNQQNINFCVSAFGKESHDWIGKKVGIFTETIKGNESIRFQGAA